MTAAKVRVGYDRPEDTQAVKAAPSYEEIADAIETALDSSCITVLLDQDGHPAELWQLARCLDKAGLIDWTGVRR